MNSSQPVSSHKALMQGVSSGAIEGVKYGTSLGLLYAPHNYATIFFASCVLRMGEIVRRSLGFQPHAIFPSDCESSGFIDNGYCLDPYSDTLYCSRSDAVYALVVCMLLGAAVGAVNGAVSHSRR